MSLRYVGRYGSLVAAARPSRSAARLAAILDQLPDALLLVDSSGRIVNVNARAISAFYADDPEVPGMRPLIGLPLTDLLPGFGHGRGPETRSRESGSGRRAAPERMVARGLDGTSFPVDVSRSVLLWNDTDELLLLVIRLISESGPPETELYRAQQQTQAILRAAEQAVCGVDAEGRVVLANPAASRMLGLRASEVAGKDLHALALHTRIDGSPYPADASPLSDTLQTGRTHRRLREVVWRQDGMPVPVEMTTVAIKEGDEVVGAIATFTDTTRELDLEDRRERLVAVLEEDLRPQLASLQDAVRRLRADVSPQGVARLLAHTSDAAERLLTRIDVFVGHEHFVAGATQLRPHRADIGQLVEVAVEATAATAEAGGVIVAVFVEPIAVEVDTERVIAALTELLNGAVAASSEGSTVAVTTSRRGRYVRVVVRDTAPGADQAHEHPLLQRLLPRPAGAAAPPLDVPFVRAVADRHDGRFVVEAAPGGGVSYALELPLELSRASEDFRRALPSRPTRARHAAAGPADVERPPAAENDHDGEPALPSAPLVAAAPPVSATRPRSIPPPPAPALAPPPAPTPAAGGGSAQQILVWPRPHESTARALTSRGWSSIPIQQPREVAAPGRAQAAALLVDPLTGPVTRRMLQDVRAAAVRAGVPMLVAAGFGEVRRDAAGGGDPAALIGALRPPGEGASRVLLLEEDPALAAAVGATLERRGMRPLVVRSESEAMLRAAVVSPDLVVLDLSLPPAPRPGIIDWLRAQGRLHETPVVAYAAADLGPDRDRRLRTGETVLALQPRPETQAVDERIAELVLRLAGTPKPW
jgi:PAS domain S-box-containing protein